MEAHVVYFRNASTIGSWGDAIIFVAFEVLDEMKNNNALKKEVCRSVHHQRQFVDPIGELIKAAK